MVKYYCDICGKENKYPAQQLSSLEIKIFQGNYFGYCSFEHNATCIDCRNAIIDAIDDKISQLSANE